MSHSDNIKIFQDMLDEGYHCSQCVFCYWAERLGIDDEFAKRITSGLGMGVNHGDSCGAVTSTALAFGLVNGFSEVSESGTHSDVEGEIDEFVDAFIDRNGSLLCRDLLSGGYDAANPDAIAPKGVNPWEHCAKYCADAVELAEVYLTPNNLDQYSSLGLTSDVREQKDQPSPYIVAAGSGVTGLALGVLATLVITYEKRRAKNERKMRKFVAHKDS